MAERINTSGASAKEIAAAIKEALSSSDEMSQTTLKIKTDSSIYKAKEEVEGLTEALKAYDEYMAKSKMNHSKTAYFTSEEKAINRLKNAWNEYAKERNAGIVNNDNLASSSSAKQVLVFANALEALTGTSSSIGEVSEEIAQLVSQMREMPNFKTYNLGVNQFKELFDILKAIQKVYPDISEITKPFKGVEIDVDELLHITNNQKASEAAADAYERQGQAAEEAAQKIEKLTKAEMERKLKAEHEKGEVNEWAYNFDEEEDKLQKYNQALDELKQKQKEVLEFATYYNNKLADGETTSKYGTDYQQELDYQIKRYHEYTDEIEFVHNKLQEAIRTSTPNAKGNNAQELNSLVIILKDLHEEVIKISSAFANVDDESGIGNLIKSLQEMNVSLTDAIAKIGALGDAFKDKDFNISIGMGSSDPVARNAAYGSKANETISTLTQQKKELEKVIKEMYGVGEEYTATMKLFQGTNILEKTGTDIFELFDNLNDSKLSKMGRMDALQKYISMIKEAANIKGIDLSHVFDKFTVDADKAVESTKKILTGEEEMEKAANKLFDLFGGANKLDLSGMTVQLDGVVQQLKEISQLIEKGFTVNDILNGKQVDTGEEVSGLEAVKKSVDSITESVNKKTEAFKNEAATVATIVPDETNYLGKLISALKIINENLDKITQFSGLDLSKFKAPEVKQGQIAEGATHVSNNPKEARKVKERTTTKADSSLTADQIKARTQSLTETTSSLENSLTDQGSVIKQIIEFYDSQDNLVKTVIKEERELDGIIKGTTWTTNYDLKKGSSYSSHIDTSDYDKIRKQEERERIAQEKRIANEEKKTRSKLINESYSEEKKWLKEIYALKEKNAQAVEKNSPTQERDIAYNNALIKSYKELIEDERNWRKEKGLDDGNRNLEYEQKLLSGYEAKRDAYNQSLAETVKLAEQEAYLEKERLELVEKNKIESNRQKALDFAESEKERLASAVSKYSYGDSSEARKMIDKLNAGVGAVGDLSKVEDGIKKVSANVDKLISDMKSSHEAALGALNDEIAAEDKKNQLSQESYDRELKAETEINKLKIKNISAKTEDVAKNNELISQQEKLVEQEQQLRRDNDLANDAKEVELQNQKVLLAKELNNQQEAYNAKLFESEKIGNENAVKTVEEHLGRIQTNKKKFEHDTTYIEEINALKQKIKEFNENAKLEITSESQRTELTKLRQEIEEMYNSVNAHTKNFDFQLVDKNELYKQMTDIRKIINDNTAMPLGLKELFKALEQKYQIVIDNHSVMGTVTKVSGLNEELAELKYRLQESGKTGNSVFTLISKKIKGITAEFFAMYFSLYDLLNLLRGGFETIKEYDTALTEMNKVSKESLSTLKEFQQESFKLADAIGATASAVQNSTADWMRLGESLEEAAKSAEATNILFNVSEFESIDEATDSLVSMSQAYKDLEKMDIVDIMNNIGNNYSISTDGLASALQKSASALTTAGNDINEAVALITAGNAIAQDPDSVGAGLRTISLRLVGTEAAKAELEALGEEADNVITTTSKLRDVILSATKAASEDGKGFDILDDNGNYKSTYEIMLGLSELYDDIVAKDKELGTNNLNLLLETIAGKNRSNIAASILQNSELLESVYQSSLDSEGSALKENEAYLESIQGHLNQLSNTWDSLWVGENNREVINFFIDFAKWVLESVDAIGGLKTVLLGGGGIFAGFKLFQSGGRAKCCPSSEYATGEFSSDVYELCVA